MISSRMKRSIRSSIRSAQASDHDRCRQVLLLTFFFNYMRPLFDAGKIYIALPPLFQLKKKGRKKDEVRYVWTEDELVEAQKEMGKNVELQRYKGLGEMMPEQLWETTMNPETRTLIQVRIEDEALSKWIESNVSFTLEDADSMMSSVIVLYSKYVIQDRAIPDVRDMRCTRKGTLLRRASGKVPRL